MVCSPSGLIFHIDNRGPGVVEEEGNFNPPGYHREGFFFRSEQGSSSKALSALWPGLGKKPGLSRKGGL